MERWPKEIAPLPPRTRSFLRSTVILSSLVQVVSELIQNSLDASARTIQVAIDCDEWSCWVQDDGTGFTIDDLESLANNSKADSMRYSTSKVSGGDHTSFGFRGEGEPHVLIARDPGLTLNIGRPISALASIADLSVLEISSRTAKARQSWSVIAKVRTSHNPLTRAHTLRLGNGSFVFRTLGALAKAISWYHRLCQGCIP